MDFIYLFRILLKRKWIIIGATLLATVCAYVLTRNEPKKYRSFAQVSTGFTISNEIRVADENFSFYEADTKFNNAIVTATSPTVVGLLGYALMLHDLESPYPFMGLTAEQRKSPVFRNIDPQQTINLLHSKFETMTMLSTNKPEEKMTLEFMKLFGYDYRTISKYLNVYRLQRTDYIQIEYVSPNPELSAFVVNEDFKQFIRYYKNIRSDRSQESIDTLQSLLEKKKATLDEKNKQLQSEGILDVGQENSSKLALISNLETTLTQERNNLTTLQYSLQKINQRLNSLNSGTSANPGTTAGMRNNDELLQLRQEMNDAYTAYVNSGSQDQALLKKYNSLKQEYQNKIVNSSPTTGTALGVDAQEPVMTRPQLLQKKSDLELDIQAANTNIGSITNKIATLQSGLSKDAVKGAAVESLIKDVDLANKEYLDAKQKYNEALDLSSASVTNFRQVLLGQPAIEPEPSKRLIIVGMSGASVFVISLLVIVLLVYLDSAIKTPETFSRMVNLKLMGIVNFMNLRRRSLEELVTNREHSDESVDRNNLNVFRESLRKLRFEIEQSNKKIFLFTSCKKGEGKTTLIQALSYSMSMSKKRILIIDTNFCNPDLTTQLSADPILEKIRPNPGENGNANRNVLEQVREASKNISGTVFAIGSQGGDYTPSEILPRENLLKHLSALTAEYDYIFLEGPPLNDFSDSKELAQFADGVIAIFSATNVIKQIDKQSMSFFRDLNGKFTGAILNKVDMENINVT
jgi:polysaccharide biosynthesis transport protein